MKWLMKTNDPFNTRLAEEILSSAAVCAMKTDSPAYLKLEMTGKHEIQITAETSQDCSRVVE